MGGWVGGKEKLTRRRRMSHNRQQGVIVCIPRSIDTHTHTMYTHSAGRQASRPAAAFKRATGRRPQYTKESRGGGSGGSGGGGGRQVGASFFFLFSLVLGSLLF